MTRVTDGDTYRVDIDGEDTTLRLIGVDTPETKHPNKPVQCYGPEASAEARRLVDGGRVWLATDPTQGDEDKYGRALVYVWTQDGTLVNEHLIRQGFAREYTYRRPYERQAAFRAAEDEAQAASRGLWAGCATSTPTATDATEPAPSEGAGSEVHFSSCAAAREAGAAPLVKGGPGYRAGLDGDGDGVACE